MNTMIDTYEKSARIPTKEIKKVLCKALNALESAHSYSEKKLDIKHKFLQSYYETKFEKDDIIITLCKDYTAE